MTASRTALHLLLAVAAFITIVGASLGAIIYLATKVSTEALFR